MRAGKIGLGLGIAAGVGVLLYATTAGASGRGREPVRTKTPLPANDAERAAVRTAICQCHRGGATGDGLLVCAMRQVWGAVDWASVVATPVVEGDDPSISQALAYVRKEIEAFLALDPADHEGFCNLILDPDVPDIPLDPTEPIDDDPPVEDDPPTPQPAPPAGPPPDAPPFPDLLRPNEVTIATVIVGRYGEAVRTGELEAFEAEFPRQGVKDDVIWLTNTAYRINYQSVPGPKIPKNWQQKKSQWQPWVDAWLRLRDYVMRALDEAT